MALHLLNRVDIALFLSSNTLTKDKRLTMMVGISITKHVNPYVRTSLKGLMGRNSKTTATQASNLPANTTLRLLASTAKQLHLTAPAVNLKASLAILHPRFHITEMVDPSNIFPKRAHSPGETIKDMAFLSRDMPTASLKAKRD